MFLDFLSFFSLLKLSSLCCYVFIFFIWYLYLYLYFLHLFYITGHLYYNTDLKILFLRFKYRITRINGEGQDIMKLIAYPLIKLQFSLG